MTMNNNKNQGNTGFRIRMFFKRLDTTGEYRRVLYISIYNFRSTWEYDKEQQEVNYYSR